jgi:hypothetical protein
MAIEQGFDKQLGLIGGRGAAQNPLTSFRRSRSRRNGSVIPLARACWNLLRGIDNCFSTPAYDGSRATLAAVMVPSAFAQP